MIDSVCQAYHWSLDEAMSLTLPQIIMLNHAAWVNQERSKRRVEKKHKTDERRNGIPATESDVVVGEKTMDQMTSEEIARYTLQWE